MPHMFRAPVKKSPFLKCFEQLKVTNPKFQKLKGFLHRKLTVDML